MQTSPLSGRAGYPNSAKLARTTGTITGFQNNAAAGTQADSLMENWMKVNGMRQAQFTIGKNGNILLQKAYSWSEATRHTKSDE
jgi:hypothetical protein